MMFRFPQFRRWFVICVSIGHCSPERAHELARCYGFVEFRLDTIPGVRDHIAALFQVTDAIATCRPVFGDQRTELLFAAMEAGARYVDLELEAEREWRKRCVDKARSCGTAVILSHHDMERTPPDDELNQWMEKGSKDGADIVKLACACASHGDCMRLLKLATEDSHKRIVLGMGPYGIPSRFLGPLIGAPFTFGAPDGQSGTAPGQLPHGELVALMSRMGKYMHVDS